MNAMNVGVVKILSYICQANIMEGNACKSQKWYYYYNTYISLSEMILGIKVTIYFINDANDVVCVCVGGGGGSIKYVN